MRFFRTPAEFRNWLAKNHDRRDEVIVGLYKKGSAKKGITYEEARDQALCFGWIDGITRRVDDDSYCIRFTPRRRNSVWSQVNVGRVKELTRLGLMEAPGLEAFERGAGSRSTYSYENPDRELGAEYEKTFKKNAKAWEFFSDQPPSYRRGASWWVTSAKKEETRLRRLQTLIEDSEQGLRVKPLRRND